MYHEENRRLPRPDWALLAAILSLAAAVRFWHLSMKALWIDEVSTALVCLGRGAANVPIETTTPFARVSELMSPAPGAGPSAVIALLKDPSISNTHPPLFYVLMNAWYTWMPPSWSTLSWDLRFVPAVLGVVCVVAMFGLLRTAFPGRPAIARIGATAAAVSPLMLLISQEARNYTLPLLILLLVLRTTISIARAYAEGRPSRLSDWLAWILLNAAGCYAHYYFMFAVGAQCAALAVVFHSGPPSGPTEPKRSLRAWTTLVASAVAIVLLFAPWIPTLIDHSRNPLQNWLALTDPADFVTQIVSSAVVMFVAGPGGSPPLPVIVLWTAASLAIAVLFSMAIWRGLKRIRAEGSDRLVVMMFVVLLGVSLAELIAVSLVLRQNLFIAPRYSFVWYPPVCALLAAGLSGLERIPSGSPLWRRVFDRHVAYGAVVTVGVLSAIAIDSDVSFEKGFQPRRVAENINRRPSDLVAFGYNNFVEICIGLSYAITLEQQNPAWHDRSFAFVRRSVVDDRSRGRSRQPGYIWQSIAALRAGDRTFGDLWVVAPGLLEQDVPAELDVGGGRGAGESCVLDPSRIFDSANNVRGPSGEWTARRVLTSRGGNLYAYYRCATSSRQPS